jgi:hypothetical protein
VADPTIPTRAAPLDQPMGRRRGYADPRFVAALRVTGRPLANAREL